MKKIGIIILLAAFVITAQGQDIAKWKMTDVENYMKTQKDEILIINFWATFCKPCVAEIPSFIKITEKYAPQNAKLLLVSLDLPSYYPKKIAAFAKKNDFNTNIVWLDETNADYFCPIIDQSWSGSIPATLVIYPKTGFKRFFEGEIEAEDFEKAIQAAIQSNAALNNNAAMQSIK